MEPTPVTTRLEAWRVAFVCFVFFMGVNAFYSAFGTVPDKNVRIVVSSNGDNPLYVGLWLALYAVSGLVVLRAWMTNGISLRVLALAPFAAYVIASAAWSENPTTVATRATMLALNIVIAEALCSVVHPLQLLRILARLNLLLLLVSFVMLAVMPDHVLSDPARPGILMSGELFGAFGNKTMLGRMSCFTIIIILFVPGVFDAAWKKVLAISALMVGALLANSMSSLVGGSAAVAIIALARVAPPLATTVFTGAAALAVTWSLAAPFIEIGALATSIGRTADVTGRSDFWPMAPAFIMERPYLGYGYNDFFSTAPYAAGWRIWSRELWFFTPEFHNNFIDITIGLGLVGAACYLAILAAGLSVFAHRTLDRRCREVLGALLIFITINNATEYNFLTHNSISTILLFFCVLVGGRRYSGLQKTEVEPGHGPVEALPGFR